MKKLYFLFFLVIQFVNAQLSVPYTNDFNSTTSDEGWIHYAITGTDDWGRGLPTGGIDENNFAWETKLLGVPSNNSNRVLVSPSYDLTNANFLYVLSFNYKSNLNSGNLYLEYSIDNGATWSLLNPTTTLKRNWQSSTGFSLSNTNGIFRPALNLSFLQGNGNVKFRFRCVTNSTVNGYGFVIDNFSIAPENYNVFATASTPVEISPLCPSITIKTEMGFDNQYITSYVLETKYYFSTDMVFDAGDTYLGFQSVNTAGTVSSYNITFATPPNLEPGQYYVVYQHDSANTVTEVNEIDNYGFCSIVVKPIFNLPYSTDFEQDDANWKTGQSASSTIPMMWEKGLGRRHHIEKSHSGINAWHTSNTIIEHPDYTFQWVESPYFNPNNSQETFALNFWYKSNYPNGVDYYDNVYLVQYSINCSETWNNLYTIPSSTSDDWEYLSIPLNSTLSASSNIKFRITYHSAYILPEGLIFDDFYFGPIKADLTIEKLYGNKRFTTSNSANDVLNYQIRNAGDNIVQNAVTKFYWSTDELFDSSDILLGEQTVTNLSGDNTGQLLSFNYTKPTLLIGDYYIIYKLDSTNLVDESRENNNTGVIPIEQTQTVPFPYFNDFETQTNNWVHEATLGQDDWAIATPNGNILDTAFSGNKAWISNASNGVTSMSRMHLYTPAFDLSSSVNPVLEFDMKLDNFGGCSCFELTLNLSYSTDNGASWSVLEPINNSYSKWGNIQRYNESNGLDTNYMLISTETMFDLNEVGFSNHTHYNSRDIDRNTKYIINIPQLKNETNIRFRYNLSTMLNDGSSSNANGRILEGALIDNFQIREAEIDLNVPYSKNLYLSSLANNLHLSIDIKNSGNLISNETNIKFYLSNDTTYNTGDFYLGTSTLDQIRPDFKSNKILDFTLPSNLTAYQYLIYVIDDNNANIESDEANNQGAWSLGLGGVATFPYLENFEGDIINGWKGYAYDSFTSNVLTNYRVTNKIAVSAKNNFYLRNYNGVLRTENVPYGSWQDYLTPLYYIESPTFNFTTYNSDEPLILSFDVMCIGSNFTNGGNMQYSIDGGQTWIVMTTSTAPTQNWYPNYNTMSNFGSQPGWFGYENSIINAKMNISFLQNQSNVIFRYKYFSNYASSSSSPRGIRIDNFTIGQETMVADINCFENVPYDMNFENFEESCWETGTNSSEIILLNRSEDIKWEIAPNFANVNNNSSAKVDLIDQGNTNGVWMISPKFNMVAGNKLAFNIALSQLNSLAPSSLDSDDRIILKYSNNNGVTWIDLKTWNNTTPISNTGQQILINSIPTSGELRFAFWATNGIINGASNSTFYVDNFQLYTGTLGVLDHNDFYVKCHPNPVSNFLNIQSQTKVISNIELYNMSGQLLETFEINEKEAMIDFKSYAKGAYFLKIITDNGSKIIKILK